MDEIENAINEGRRVSTPEEKVWLPSAPQLSPEKILLGGTADKTTSLPEPTERESPAEQKIIISRFTVTKTPVSSPAGDTTSKTSNSLITTEVYKQVMQGKDPQVSSDPTSTTTTTTTTTSTNTDSSSSPKTTTIPASTNRQPSPDTEDGGKILGVIATQTEDMEHETSERTLTTLAFLQEAVKEIKTMIAPASSEESGRWGPLVKLKENKYCKFWLMVVILLCLFIIFMWLLSTFSTSSVSQLNPPHLDSIEALEISGQQIHQESGDGSEEEVSALASKNVEKAGTEGPSDPEEMHDPSLSADGTDTDEEVRDATGEGEGEVGMEATGSLEDELLEEDNAKEPPFIPQSNIEHEQSEDIDSQTLQGEQITNVANIKPTILRVIYLKTQQCQEKGEVFLARYVDMYRHLLHFFNIFGTFATVQGRMLESRLLNLEIYIRGRNGYQYTTLATMIRFEDATDMIGRISPFSGTILFTCLQRHLQFMCHCLANILPLSPDMSLLHAFTAAYEEVLAIHHAWFVENFYLTGIGMLPTKQAALKGVASVQGGDDISPEIVHNSILAVVRALEQLTNASEAVLVNTYALQKIPKQVIT